jgi:Electron transfer DM13
MTTQILQRSSAAAAIAIITLLTLSPLGCSAAKPPVKASEVAQNTMMKKSTGAFVSVEHATTGNVSIVTEGKQRYLALDQSFTTSEGPDLFVILHQSTKPKSYDKNNYVSLGKLQKIAGTQRYAIPENLDLKSFKTAVIWCRQFSATFAYAPLS